MFEPRARPGLTLLAGCIVTGTLGSVHAFSVFLVPLERLFETSRSSVSLVYSLALVTLTLMVLIGHRLYAMTAPANLAALACVGAALGLICAGSFGTLNGTYLGYGVLFGAANGVGYGFVLQLVAQALPGSAGLAMGTVTAVYALGSILFAKLYAVLLMWMSVGETMFAMAAVLLVAAALVWLLLQRSRASYQAASAEQTVGSSSWPSNLVVRLWLGYGTGAAAGLMAIGHATGIVLERGGSASLMVAGAMTIGAGNAAGGIVAGYWSDRIAPNLTLCALPLVSCVSLIVLAVVAGPGSAVWVLAVIGFCYGAIIAVYPAAVAALFGLDHAALIYGRVFTAWGLAGLLAPWIAGLLFDHNATYTLPILVAAALGLVSAGLGAGLPRRGSI